MTSKWPCRIWLAYGVNGCPTYPKATVLIYLWTWNSLLPSSAQQLIDSPDDLIASLGQRADPNTQLPNRYGDNLQRVQDDVDAFDGERWIETRIGN